MADNSWFTVFTTLLGTASGAGLTYLTNFLSEKRRIKCDEEKEHRAEKERLNKKSIFIIEKMRNIFFQGDPVDILYLEKLKNGILEDDLYDILQICDESIFQEACLLRHQLNFTITKIHLLEEWKSDYNKRNMTKIVSQYVFDENNKVFFKDIENLEKKIEEIQKKNNEDIKKFLFAFINGKNFPDKNIEIKLPKADGGFEIIKRTVP
ncbi:hypothetical protein [Zymomonas mobilis]|uniref:hypothetical protein n=1 Tax=Zymomonas mobilis TaxID=542 RepID=UPI00114113F0|nr:hypothetical protein [Zymomonas mobilis]